jgi:hypothetical protein
MIVLDVRRDGRWLVLSADNRFSIRVRRPGAEKEIDLPWMDAEWVPKLNADGTLVMFTDGNQSAGGNYAVSLRKTDGSPPLRLGEGNGIDLAPDGKYALAYLFSPTPRIVVYPTGAGEPRTVDIAPIENGTAAATPTTTSRCRRGCLKSAVRAPNSRTRVEARHDDPCDPSRARGASSSLVPRPKPEPCIADSAAIRPSAGNKAEWSLPPSHARPVNRAVASRTTHAQPVPSFTRRHFGTLRRVA